MLGFVNVPGVKQSELNEVKEIASTAKSTADTAKSTADTAKSTADAAKTSASNAEKSASNAETTANTAKSTAESAQSTADTAKSTADTAKSTADTAKSTADSALSSVTTLSHTIDMIPIQDGTLTYTGSSQSPSWNGYDSTKLTLGGTKTGTNAGEYNATFTPKDGYTWADGTKTAKTAKWRISKASLTVTLSSTALSVAYKTAQTITATRSGDGNISVTSSEPKVATVSVDGNNINISPTKSGSTTITVSVDSSANYEAGEATCVVTVSGAKVYGVQWDGTSTTAWTRTDDAASFVDPVPYVSGASAYSSPFDDIQPWAGMERVSDDVCGELVKIPKFWFKWTKSEQERADFYVSPAHADRGDGKGERDVVYVGRYHCGATAYKSVSGQKPKVSITRATARSSIAALGTGVYQWDMAMRVTIQMLYLVEFANWNSQTKIGYGCGNGSSAENVGASDSMPYHTGTMQTARTTYGVGVQYRYIEGLWDNVYDWLDGCYYSSAGLSIITNPANFSDTSGGTAVGKPSGGYPTVMAVATASGLEWVIYPTTANGSDTTYIPDFWFFNSSYPCLRVGGNYSQDLGYGLFYVYYNSASYTSSSIGCRLQKLP
jgi:hypothetical protein